MSSVFVCYHRLRLTKRYPHFFVDSEMSILKQVLPSYQLLKRFLISFKPTFTKLSTEDMDCVHRLFCGGQYGEFQWNITLWEDLVISSNCVEAP